MPQIVVTQTAKEYSDYTKKKAKEALNKSIATIIIFLIAITIIYYLLWEFIHV